MRFCSRKSLVTLLWAARLVPNSNRDIHTQEPKNELYHLLHLFYYITLPMLNSFLLLTAGVIILVISMPSLLKTQSQVKSHKK